MVWGVNGASQSRDLEDGGTIWSQLQFEAISFDKPSNCDYVRVYFEIGFANSARTDLELGSKGLWKTVLHLLYLVAVFSRNEPFFLLFFPIWSVFDELIDSFFDDGWVFLVGEAMIVQIFAFKEGLVAVSEVLNIEERTAKIIIVQRIIWVNIDGLFEIGNRLLILAQQV